MNEGKLAEQFIAQELYFTGTPHQAPELHYWLREERTGNAEVDFLEAAGGGRCCRWKSNQAKAAH